MLLINSILIILFYIVIYTLLQEMAKAFPKVLLQDILYLCLHDFDLGDSISSSGDLVTNYVV